jgi:hypothetical protein
MKLIIFLINIYKLHLILQKCGILIVYETWYFIKFNRAKEILNFDYKI